jgi:integrase
LARSPTAWFERQFARARDFVPRYLFGCSEGSSFAGFLDDYIDHLKRRMATGDLKPRSYVEIERHLLKHFKPLHKLVISSIIRSTIATRLREIAKQNGPGAADRTRSNVSTFFAWAIGEGICDSNPVDGTNKHSETVERERSLIAMDGEKPNYDELITLWKGLPDSEYGKIIRLLILTMCRRDEIGSLEWSEIDREARLIRFGMIMGSFFHEHCERWFDNEVAVLANIALKPKKQIHAETIAAFRRDRS